MILHEGDGPMTPADYVAQLRRELEVFERWKAEPYITACKRMIDDLTAMADTDDEGELTLRAAAAECGYSEDHLGRLVRRGTLKNYGRPGSPRVRRGDLPRRPASPLLSTHSQATLGTSKRSIARRITGAT